MADTAAFYSNWGQGDVSLDVGALPHVNANDEIVDVEVLGVILISQTCDIVNDVAEPGAPAFVQVAGLVEQDPKFVEEVRKFRRPNYLYVPALAEKNIVADLGLVATFDRMALEKWTRIPAPDDTVSKGHCSFALGRQRSRHAFPDQWAKAFGKLRDWLKSKAGKQSDEGRFVDAIEEVRVIADDVDFPKSVDVICMVPASLTEAQRHTWAKSMCPTMMKKFDPEWCSDIVVRLATTREMTAEEYLSGRPLDFEAMSRAANDDTPQAMSPKIESGEKIPGLFPSRPK